MSKPSRRTYRPEQKAELLRKHHLEKVPVSDLCNAEELQPSVFYSWQRQLFERAPGAFEAASKSGSSREKELEAKLAEAEARAAKLEAKLAKKDSVIAEISAEYVDLKKELGVP